MSVSMRIYIFGLKLASLGIVWHLELQGEGFIKYGIAMSMSDGLGFSFFLI